VTPLHVERSACAKKEGGGRQFHNQPSLAPGEKKRNRCGGNPGQMKKRKSNMRTIAVAEGKQFIFENRHEQRGGEKTDARLCESVGTETGKRKSRNDICWWRRGKKGRKRRGARPSSKPLTLFSNI